MPLAYLAAPALLDANVQLHPNTQVTLVDPATGEAPNIYATAISTVPLTADAVTSDANGNFRSSAGRYWTDSTSSTFIMSVPGGPGLVDIDVFQLTISETQAAQILASTSSYVKSVLLTTPDSQGDVSFNISRLGGASQASLDALSDTVTNINAADLRAQIVALQNAVVALGGSITPGPAGATWYPADATPAELALRLEVDGSYPAFMTGDPGITAPDKVYFGSTHAPDFDGASLADLTTQFGRPLGGTYYSNDSTVQGLQSAFLTQIVPDETNGAFMRYERDTSKRAEQWGEPASLNGQSWWAWIASGGMDDDKTVTFNGVTATLFGLRTEARTVMKGRARIVSREHEFDILSEAGGYIWPFGSSTTVACGTGADFQAMWQHVWNIYRQEWSADPTLNWPIWYCNMSYSPRGGTFGKTSSRIFASSSITDTGSDGYFPGWNYVDMWGIDPYDNSGAVVSGSAVTSSQSWASMTADMLSCYDAFCNPAGGRTIATSPAGVLPNKPIWYGERGVMDKLTGVSYTNTKLTSDAWMAAMAANDAANSAKTAGATWFSKNYAAMGSVNSSGLLTAPRFAFGTDADETQKWAGLRACGGLSVYQTAKGWQSAPNSPTPPTPVTGILDANLTASSNFLVLTASAATSTASSAYPLQDFQITWPDGTVSTWYTTFTAAVTHTMAAPGTGNVTLTVRDTSGATNSETASINYTSSVLFNAVMTGTPGAAAVNGDAGIGGAVATASANAPIYGSAGAGYAGSGTSVITGNATGSSLIGENYQSPQKNVFIRGYLMIENLQLGAGSATIIMQEKLGTAVPVQLYLDNTSGFLSFRNADLSIGTGVQPTSTQSIQPNKWIRFEYTRTGAACSLDIFATDPTSLIPDDTIDMTMKAASTADRILFGVTLANATTQIAFSNVAGNGVLMPLPISGSAAPTAPGQPTMGTITSPNVGQISVPYTLGSANGSTITKVTLTATPASSGTAVRTWKSGMFDTQANFPTWTSTFYKPQVIHQFCSYMGTATGAAAFTQQTANITNRQSGGTWLAGSDDGSTTNVVSIALVPSQATSIQSSLLSAAAGGSDVASWTALGNALVAAGMNHGSTVLRVGWEMNGNWYAWATGGDATLAGYFKAAWIYAYNAVHAVAPNVRFNMCWNASNGGNASFALHYPGDAYVDIIGVDEYDYATAAITTDAAYASYANGTGIADAAIFANAHGKQIALNEWGVDGAPGSHGDNAAFIQATFDALLAANTTYPGIVAFDTYENDPTSAHVITGGTHPLSAAKYKALWTATGAVPLTRSFTASPALFTGVPAGTWSVRGTDTNAIGTSGVSTVSNSVTVTAGGSTALFNASMLPPTGAIEGQVVVNGDSGLGTLTTGTGPNYSLSDNSIRIKPGASGFPLLTGVYPSATVISFDAWGYKPVVFPVGTYDNIAQYKNGSSILLKVRQDKAGTLSLASSDGNTVATSKAALTAGSKYSLCLVSNDKNVSLKIYHAGGAFIETVTIVDNISATHTSLQLGATGGDANFESHIYDLDSDSAVEPPVRIADPILTVPPTAPPLVTATALPDAASQKILWLAPASAGSPATITQYQVFLDGALVATTAGTVLTATLTTLSTGSHSVSVKASNGLLSPASGAASFTIGTPTTLGGPPVPIASDAYTNLATPGVPIFQNTFWTQTGVASAPLHPNNDAIIHELSYTDLIYTDPKTGVTTPIYGGVAALNIHQYNTSTIIAPSGTPKVRVYFYDQQNKGTEPASFTAAFASVPVPDNAVPSSGTDGQLTIIDQDTGDIWECWQMKFNRAAGVNDHNVATPAFPDEWSCCWGGKDNIYSTTGWFLNGMGASSTGCIIAGGVIGIREMQYALAHGNAPLGHTLNIAANNVAPAGSYQWPAQRGDGGSSSVSLMAEGQWLRLDPTINVDQLPGLTNIARVIAKTCQVHGMIVTDQSGALSVICESPNQLKAAGQVDPWNAMQTNSSGTLVPEWTQLTNFPWGSFQALAPNWGAPAGYATYKVPSSANTTVQQNKVLFATCASNAAAVQFASWLNLTTIPTAGPYKSDPAATHNLIDVNGNLIATCAYVSLAQQAAVILNSSGGYNTAVTPTGTAATFNGAAFNGATF